MHHDSDPKTSRYRLSVCVESFCRHWPCEAASSRPCASTQQTLSCCVPSRLRCISDPDVAPFGLATHPHPSSLPHPAANSRTAHHPLLCRAPRRHDLNRVPTIFDTAADVGRPDTWRWCTLKARSSIHDSASNESSTLSAELCCPDPGPSWSLRTSGAFSQDCYFTAESGGFVVNDRPFTIECQRLLPTSPCFQHRLSRCRTIHSLRTCHMRETTLSGDQRCILAILRRHPIGMATMIGPRHQMRINLIELRT